LHGERGDVRGWIYDRALLALTAGWYREVLGRMPHGSRLLDVGIGTAGALLANADLVVARDLRVVGVDIDGDYVARARRKVAAVGLSDRVEVRHEPLEAHRRGPYDAVYFAASFMLFPDPDGALRHASTLLGPGGRVVFTQTFQEKPSAVLERFKPALHRVTGIHFGRVTYERDFLDTLERGGLRIDEHVVLRGGRAQSSRLVVAAPRAGT
jgi:ubiquinone/menaquinone biosynthesis C-methylase UbiE